MTCAADSSSFWVAIRIVRAIDGVNVEDGQFGGRRADLKDRNPPFVVPGHRSVIDLVVVAKISTQDAADAVDFAVASETTCVVGIVRQYEMSFVCRSLFSRFRNRLCIHSSSNCVLSFGVFGSDLDLLQKEN